MKWLDKTPHPYDSRFPLSPKDIAHGARKSGKRRALLQELGKKGQFAPQQPGYFLKGRFRVIPEMVPEFIVPDLTDCKMKPYVSYKVGEFTQNELTPAELFKATYAKEILEKFHEGKLDVEKLKPGDILKEKDKS